MPSTTLLPIGTWVYYKGCGDNPVPDFGWITAHRTAQTYCNQRDEQVHEPHYEIEWADGQAYYSTQAELEGDDFIILEDTCD